MSDDETTEIPESAPGDPGAASSGASSTSDPLIGDTGPGVRPGQVPPAPGEPGAGPELGPPMIFEWTPEQARTLLADAGDGLHAVAGVGEHDWQASERDLERMAPPLCRIVNRHEPLQRAALRSDEISLLIASGLYAWRSMLERRAVLEERERHAEAAASGTAPGRPAGPMPGTPPPMPADSEPGAAPSVLQHVEIAEGYVPAAERLRQQQQPPPQQET